MDSFIIDDGTDLYLNKDYSELYSNKVKSKEMDDIFKHPIEKLNEFNKKSFTSIFDFTDIGDIGGIGKNSKKLNTTYFKILPTFINVVKGRIIYQGKTKLSLEKIQPTNKKGPIILGTLIELSKIKKNLEKETLTKKDIEKYIKEFDIVPLLYNTIDNKDKEIIFKNRKKTFFTKDAKLCLVTFELQEVTSFYAEVPTKEIKINFEDIDDIIKEKNYIVAHYIYDNFFFLVPSHKLKMLNCYLINVDEEQNTVEIKETKDFVYEPNNRKLYLTEIDNIIHKIRSYFSSFN